MPSTLPSPKPSAPNASVSSNAKKPDYVLDSYALFALLQNEKGRVRVIELVAQAQNDSIALHLSLINWGEIIYAVERRQSAQVAREVMQDIDKMPIALVEVNRARVEAAAHIKSQYAVSYADAFAIALAQELNATLVTGDPEIKSVEPVISLLWLDD
jgi:predicted nucleic acid-binding protein